MMPSVTALRNTMSRSSAQKHTSSSCGGTSTFSPFFQMIPMQMDRPGLARSTAALTTPYFMTTSSGTYSDAITVTMSADDGASSNRSLMAGWIIGYASVCTSARALTAWLLTKSGSFRILLPSRLGASASSAVMSSLFSPTMCMGTPSYLRDQSLRRRRRMLSTRVSR